MGDVGCKLDRGLRPATRPGFSLVELLTVIFIIALLIAILVPSLGKARDQAKKVSTSKGLDSIKVGMEMFKNDQGSDFPQTNGFPPSFSHPPLSSFNNYSFEPHRGQFPFLEDKKPVVYGAHWLPAMLMGVDSQGYIKRSAAPKTLSPDKWYKADAVPNKPIDRAPLYVTTENAPTKKTSELAGRQPEDMSLFPDWNDMSHLPVFVDLWDQPILYYAANTAGRATNMVEQEHNQDNNYTGGEQRTGPPFYFHDDNKGFTGTSDSADPDSGTPGWQLANSGGKHAIKFHGAGLTAADIIKDENKESFARYIVDRKVYSNLLSVAEQSGSIPANTPLRPVNATSYLLISAGVDGRFGTSDDVSNLPPFDQ